MNIRTLIQSLGIVAMVLATVSGALAVEPVKVLFVDSTAVHSGWQTLIESDGHNTYTKFDSGTYDMELADQASKDYVEGFDVAIISGSNHAFGQLMWGGANWNARSIPLLSMASYLNSGHFANDNAWRWVAGGDGVNSGQNGPSDVLDPSDLIWTGITLTPGTPPTTDFLTGGAGHIGLNGRNLKTGIITIAVESSATDRIGIAYAPAGTQGTQNQYYIAAMNGNDGDAPPFNAVGEQVFLNAIGVLAGRIVPPPPGTVLILR